MSVRAVGFDPLWDAAYPRYLRADFPRGQDASFYEFGALAKFDFEHAKLNAQYPLIVQ